MSKPTPRPWRVKERDIGYLDIGVGVTTIASADLGNTDPAYPEQEARANAAHIVKCVNMHEELVAALLEFKRACHNFYADNKHASMPGEFHQAQALMQQALAKVEGREE